MKLSEIRQLIEALPSEEWEYKDYDSEFTVGGGLVSTPRFGLMADKETCRFIAAMRSLAPKMLAVCEAGKALGNLSHLYEYEYNESKCEWRNFAKALAALEAEGGAMSAWYDSGKGRDSFREYCRDAMEHAGDEADLACDALALLGAYIETCKQRDEARAALEWYADKSNWMDDYVTVQNVEKRGGNKETIYRGDGGEHARQALNKSEGGEGAG